MRWFQLVKYQTQSFVVCLFDSPEALTDEPESFFEKFLLQFMPVELFRLEIEFAGFDCESTLLATLSRDASQQSFISTEFLVTKTFEQIAYHRFQAEHLNAITAVFQ